jgi:ribosomal-protein-serine acetyltransferase
MVPVEVEHAAALAELVQQNIAHLYTYLPAVTQLSTVEMARSHLLAAKVRAASGELLEWHIFVDGILCGAIRLRDIDRDDRKAKIGYFLGSQFTGKGIVTSAVSAVLAYCFKHLHLNRIELRCAAGNSASMRVAERLGFSREGLLRQDECLNGVFIDQYVYGLLAAEFHFSNTALWTSCMMSLYQNRRPS